MITVTLYTKPGCCLCEDVKGVIERVRRESPFELELRNINDRAADFAAYQHAIPVVCVDGIEIARYRLDGRTLETALHDAARRERAVESVALVMMAKSPVEGLVKTRLIPAIGARAATRVHAAFLQHLIDRLAGMQFRRRIVACDPPDAVEHIADTARDRFDVIAQHAGDLGERIASAARDVRAKFPAVGSILFVGADSPDLPMPLIKAAAFMLAAGGPRAMVLGPADDGGYWCLGVGGAVDLSRLLHGIDWSSGREADQTLAAAHALGYNVSLAGRWDDVDRPEDLRRLLGRLEHSTASSDRALLDRLASAIEKPDSSHEFDREARPS